jgi:hypothetical protein
VRADLVDGENIKIKKFKNEWREKIMTDTMLLNNGFSELTFDEVMAVDGGSWSNFLDAFIGGVLIATAPLVGLCTALASAPLGPVAVVGGVVTASVMIGEGAGLIHRALGN